MIGVQGKGVVSMGLPRMRGLKVHHVSSLLHLRNVSMGLPRMRGLKVSQYLGFDDHIIRVSMGLPRMRGLKDAGPGLCAMAVAVGFDGIAPHEGTESAVVRAAGKRWHAAVSVGLPRVRGLKVYLQCRSIHGNASFRWVDCKEATPSKASREKSLSIQLLKFLWWPIIKR